VDVFFLFVNIHIDNDRMKEKIKEEQEKITLEAHKKRSLSEL
jgi:hypothetical protein